MQSQPSTHLRGEPGAPGTATGPLWTLIIEPHDLGGGKLANPISVDDALAALAETATTLDQMATARRERGEEESAEILAMQGVMAHDAALADAVRNAAKEIGDGGTDQALIGLRALLAAGEAQAAQLASLPDEYLAARAADVRDVVGRAARKLTGSELTLPERPVILIGEDLPPSVSTEIPRSLLLGIALRGGSRTAHAVILARSAGIPCMVATAGLAVDGSLDGTTALLDGTTGFLELAPSAARIKEAAQGESARAAQQGAWAGLRGQTPKGAHGELIQLLANIGSADDAARAVAVGAAGVGLLRTEFMLLDRQTPPTEEEQVAGLTKIFAAFTPGTPVTVRLADIGGDKEIPYLRLAHEQNPFLGLRGYRLAMLADRPDLRDLFRSQVAATLRAASATGIRARIMAPMITLRSEVEDLLALVTEVRGALTARGEGAAATYAAELGVMIEVPAAALTVDLLAPGLDFISLGTNDLTQYAVAADRTNAALVRFQDAATPGVLALIRSAAEAAATADLEVGVCGEFAGSVAGAKRLVALGIHELSMEPAVIDEVRAALLA